MRATVHCGDCCRFPIETVSTFDVMIVDPPYSAHVHRKAVSQSPGRGVRERGFGFDHLTPDLRVYISQCAATVRRWSVIYSDIEGIGAWKAALETSGATYVRAVPWVRWSMPPMTGDRPPTGCEMIVVAWGAARGRKSWNGPGNLTHLDHKCLRGDGKHKAEKPLDQLLDLVSFFSDLDETVYDPCAGSGTTGLACKLLGRHFVGIEQSEEWQQKANTRIASELNARDADRHQRFLRAHAERQREIIRLAEHTAKVRAKAGAA